MHRLSDVKEISVQTPQRVVPNASAFSRPKSVLILVLVILAVVLGTLLVAGMGDTIDQTTAADLDAAIPAAIDSLLESRAVIGEQFAYIDEYVAAAIWFDYRADDRVIVVQRVDVDVSETGWWLSESGEPPAVGRNISETIWLVTDDALYEGSNASWSVEPLESAPAGPLAFGLAMLTEDDYSLTEFPVDSDVIHSTSSAGDVWTVTSPHRGGVAVQTWAVDTTGILESWVWELAGVSEPTDFGSVPFTSGRVEFTQNDEPRPIDAPELETKPVSTDYGVPEDFPLGS